jgi:hypothetical protein
VLKRAIESANAVNAVIEQDVISIFQARQRQRLDKQAAA